MKCTRIKDKAKKDVIVSTMLALPGVLQCLGEGGISPLFPACRDLCTTGLSVCLCLQTVLLDFKLCLFLIFGCLRWHFFPRRSLCSNNKGDCFLSDSSSPLFGICT